MRATYEEMDYMLENKKEFRGSSVTAEWDQKEYIVKSYSTVIFRTNKQNNIIYFDGQKYSFTTSKIQNIIRKIFNIK